MIRAVPVTPDAPTGRQWARDELSQPIYHPHQDPISWLIGKIQDFLDGLAQSTGGGYAAIWITVGLVILAVVVTVLVIGPMRRRRSAEVVTTLDDATLSAAELRAQARRAYEAGDYRLAVLFGYRALVRDGVERTVVAPLPGMTAHEAAEQLETAFPLLHEQIAHHATVFDAVAYADLAPSPQDASALYALVLDAARERPQFDRSDQALVEEAIR